MFNLSCCLPCLRRYSYTPISDQKPIKLNFVFSSGHVLRKTSEPPQYLVLPDPIARRLEKITTHDIKPYSGKQLIFKTHNKKLDNNDISSFSENLKSTINELIPYFTIQHPNTTEGELLIMIYTNISNRVSQEWHFDGLAEAQDTGSQKDVFNMVVVSGPKGRGRCLTEFLDCETEVTIRGGNFDDRQTIYRTLNRQIATGNISTRLQPPDANGVIFNGSTTLHRAPKERGNGRLVLGFSYVPTPNWSINTNFV